MIALAVALALAGSAYQLPTMSEVPTTVAPVVVPVAPAVPVDRRPMYAGAAIVVIAGVSWWSARRRARHAEGDAK